MPLTNTAQLDWVIDQSHNYIPRVPIFSGIYMSQPISRMPSAFPPGWQDFSMIPAKYVTDLGSYLTNGQVPEVWIDIEPVNNPTSECFNLQNPETRPLALNKWAEYLDYFQNAYIGPTSIYCGMPCFAEYARMVDTEQWDRISEAFDLDNQWLMDMKALEPYVSQWNVGVYLDWMFSDPNLTVEQKKNRFRMGVETSRLL